MVPWDVCAANSERSNQHREALLNAQKSAEAIVVKQNKNKQGGRGKSAGVSSMTGKGGMTVYDRKFLIFRNSSDTLSCYVIRPLKITA